MPENVRPSRRRFASQGAALLGIATFAGRAASAAARATAFADQMQTLEAGSGGRLFVAVRQGARRFAYRGSERVAICSTYKWVAAAAVLRKVDRGEVELAARRRVAAADLVPYSPVTKAYADREMTLDAICTAALTVSDNTAGNLLLAEIGGPAGLTRVFRDIGDPVSRLDRTEPTLNDVPPGDPRDTTTAVAMCDDLHAALLGGMLQPASRARLAAWLVGCTTGRMRLRGGLPAAWRSGDKTGTGDRNETCDVAIAWPPGAPPLVIAATLTGASADLAHREAMLAAVGRVAAST